MIKGLILAGGRSSRMGSDKSLIDYHGKPQREFLFDLLSSFCSEVFISCKEGDAVPEQLNPLIDVFDMDSPLNGILSAFTKDPTSSWLAVAVDMPFVNSDTVKYLLGHRDANKVASCFRDSEGEKPEPLLTLWEPGAYPLLKFFYEEGNISPRNFLEHNDICLLTIPDRKALLNVNSKDELKRIRNSDV